MGSQGDAVEVFDLYSDGMCHEYVLGEGVDTFFYQVILKDDMIDTFRFRCNDDACSNCQTEHKQAVNFDTCFANVGDQMQQRTSGIFIRQTSLCIGYYADSSHRSTWGGG